MLKLKQITIAMLLVLPYASAQADAVDPAAFDQLSIKVDAMQDSMDTAGLTGLRISAGIDPVYMYNRDKGTATFKFLNNFAPLNGMTDSYSYDNSYFGMAYIDVQKQMEDGTKMRITLAPSKSAASGYNLGNIVHEATASIPLNGDPAMRLMVGQMPDVSGYQPFVNTFDGANAVYDNQLYYGFPEYFITKNLMFDFTAATFYTGAGMDITSGPWETKLILANFNSASNDCTGPCGYAAKTSPTFIYNATYAKEEYWGYEFTGYEGRVANWTAGGASRLDQIEVDAWWTRADFNTNLQYTLGRQKDAAMNGGDAGWWGLSYLVSERVMPKLTFAGRLDYLNNQKNGGGTFNVYNTNANFLSTNPTLGNVVGDGINGFGPGGDPNADLNKGANRTSISLSATYRLSQYVALRGEVRHDMATTAAFYNFTDNTFQKTNDTVGLQTIVNF
ncbi:MAG: DUF3138 family protein [Gallionella sp.]